MNSINDQYTNQKEIENNINEKSTLKEILAPMILEVIGKKYTDIYLKRLGVKYYEFIDNLIDKKKLSSVSNYNTKINSGDESMLNKNYNLEQNNKTNKNNMNSTFWKDYDFLNNPFIVNKRSKKKNKDNPNFLNRVEISKNNQSNEEEQSESIIIKNKEEENESEDN